MGSLGDAVSIVRDKDEKLKEYRVKNNSLKEDNNFLNRYLNNLIDRRKRLQIETEVLNNLINGEDKD